MKVNGTSMKVPQIFKKLVNNIRATRGSNITNVDSRILSQEETCKLIVQYFKLNNDSYLELIKISFNKNNV